MLTQNEFEIPLLHDSRLTDDDYRKEICLGLSCNVKQREQLVTSLIKKLKRYFKENVYFVQNKQNIYVLSN